MAIDLTLSRLGEFLRSLEVGRSGEAFIIERSGEIVASSIGESPLQETPEGWERLSASASREPMIQAAVNHLQKDKNLAALESDRHIIVDREGHRYFVRIQAFYHEGGIDWLVTFSPVNPSGLTGASEETELNPFFSRSFLLHRLAIA